jgi:hypothetical protein
MVTIRSLYLTLILATGLSLTSCGEVASTPAQVTNTIVIPSPIVTITPIDIKNPTLSPPQSNVDRNIDSVQGWAVLVAKEDYSDTGGTDINTGFLNLYQLKALLDYYGWQDDHILEIRDMVGIAEMRAALDWLAKVSDQDDVVFVFIQAHGSYLREELDWQAFFPSEWANIPSNRRVLVIDACQAGEFTSAPASDNHPQLTIASSAADEFSWAGLWEEGKPIIGGVFSHYFISAFTDPTADIDVSGQISIQEAAYAAQQPLREYMHEQIFTVPEFLDGYHSYGVYPESDPDYPHVIVNDQLDEPVYLDLRVYRLDQ